MLSLINEKRADDGYTPIHDAAYKGLIEVNELTSLKFLLAKRCVLNKRFVYIECENFAGTWCRSKRLLQSLSVTITLCCDFPKARCGAIDTLP